jgi:hypothetical protein
VQPMMSRDKRSGARKFMRGEHSAPDAAQAPVF